MVRAVAPGHGRSGGGLAFLRHTHTSQPTSFLKTGIGRSGATVGAVGAVSAVGTVLMC